MKTSEESCDAEAAGLLRGAGSCRPSLGGTLRELPRHIRPDCIALCCLVRNALSQNPDQTLCWESWGSRGEEVFPNESIFSSELGYPS